MAFQSRARRCLAHACAILDLVGGLLASGVTRAESVLVEPGAAMTIFGFAFQNFGDFAGPVIFLDETYSDANGTGRGVADPASGALRATATSVSSGLASVRVQIHVHDLVTAANFSGVRTGILTVTGSGSFPELGDGGSVGAEIWSEGSVFPPPVIFPRDFDSSGGDFYTPIGGVIVEIPVTFPAPNTRVALDYILDVSARSGAVLDYFDTASLSFDLQPGEIVTSVAGFSQVPEPAASLSALVVGLLLVRRWLRQRALGCRH